MNKLSLFLLLALLSFVINETKYYGDCTDLKILPQAEVAYLDEIEGDYCASLKTTGEYTHCCMFEFSNDTKI